MIPPEREDTVYDMVTSNNKDRPNITYASRVFRFLSPVLFIFHTNSVRCCPSPHPARSWIHTYVVYSTRTLKYLFRTQYVETSLKSLCFFVLAQKSTKKHKALCAFLC